VCAKEGSKGIPPFHVYLTVRKNETNSKNFPFVSGGSKKREKLSLPQNLKVENFFHVFQTTFLQQLRQKFPFQQE